MIDLLYSFSGFVVGLLVGMTGVGGGSLTTPLLILLFGINPATAVGTDLLSAAVSKSAGTIVHGLARSIEWPVVRRLAMGSVPATIMTLGFLALLNQSEAARGLITIILSAVLLLTAAVLVFRGSIVRFYHSRLPVLDDRGTAQPRLSSVRFLGWLSPSPRSAQEPSASASCSSCIPSCRWLGSSDPTSHMPSRSHSSPAWATG